MLLSYSSQFPLDFHAHVAATILRRQLKRTERFPELGRVSSHVIKVDGVTEETANSDSGNSARNLDGRNRGHCW